jgi:hypothetical protein
MAESFSETDLGRGALAAVGLALIVYPALSTGEALLTGTAPGGSLSGWLTVGVAIVGGGLFVRTEWSLRRLWRYALVFTGCHVIGGLLALGLVAETAFVPRVDLPTLRAGVLSVAYPLTAAVDLLGGAGRFRRDGEWWERGRGR